MDDLAALIQTGPVVNGLTFDQWCDRLNAYHSKQREAGVFEGYGPGNLTEITGRECWLDFFHNEYSPEGALDEDRTYWED